MTHCMDGEDRVDYAAHSNIDADHHHVPANCQDRAKHLVLHIVLHVTLDLANLDIALKDQWHRNRANGLGKERVCAHEEAVLGPLLRVAVDRIHVQCAHACTDEKHSEHWSKVHGGGGGHQRILSLACEICCDTYVLSPAA